MGRLRLHPDRALPADQHVRQIARSIYTETASLPLICAHGHVDAALLADDTPFGDPATLLVTPDHYVTRMIHSAGVELAALGLGPAPVAGPREVWRTFCAHWHLFRGTPSRYWLAHELVEVFGVDVVPSLGTADELFDALTDRLARPAYRPRALYQRFGIEMLATTDPPLADLAAHHRLATGDWKARVIPTFRPDSLIRVDHPDWIREVTALAGVAGIDTGHYTGYLDAVERRREAFAAAGAVATDHGAATAHIEDLGDDEAARIYHAALTGTATTADADAFEGHMLFQMARMSCADGLVMQLHPGVLRDHDRAVRHDFGPDRGFDIPVAAEFTRSLRPLLEAFGHHPRFRLVLFTVDETVFSRELGPLAGVYPAVRLGAPWWFLDSPNGLRRFRETVTETAGFYNTAGFVDDTRAFASIPARHDLARRIDAGHLADLVATHLLDLGEAVETAIDLAYRIPLDLYRLPHETGPR